MCFFLSCVCFRETLLGFLTFVSMHKERFLLTSVMLLPQNVSHIHLQIVMVLCLVVSYVSISVPSCVLSVSLLFFPCYSLPPCSMFVSLCLPVLFLLSASPSLSHLPYSLLSLPTCFSSPHLKPLFPPTPCRVVVCALCDVLDEVSSHVTSRVSSLVFRFVFGFGLLVFLCLI